MNNRKAHKAVQRKRKLANRKRRVKYRLRERHREDQPEPMFAASNIHYDLSDRARGLDCGGIGAFTCWPGGPG